MPARRSARRAPRRLARGAMLIEALVAILIFSIGILGVIGLLATAVKQSTDARYRVEAAQLAEQLLGRMWSGNRAVATLQAQFNTCSSSGCAGYQDWYATVAAMLPGVTTGSTRPEVNVDAEGIVTITLLWRAPNDAADAEPHRYEMQAQIGQ